MVFRSSKKIFQIFFLVGDLGDDEGDESDSENENAVTDSEDEDECYQNAPDAAEINVMESLRVGCMKNVEIIGREISENDQYEEPLKANTTVDFHGKGSKGIHRFCLDGYKFLQYFPTAGRKNYIGYMVLFLIIFFFWKIIEKK